MSVCLLRIGASISCFQRAHCPDGPWNRHSELGFSEVGHSWQNFGVLELRLELRIVEYFGLPGPHHAIWQG